MTNLSGQIHQIWEKLHTPTVIEIFYQKLYEAEKNPVLLEHFFTTIDKQETIRGDYIIPEWPETIENRHYSELSFFRENIHRNVLLRKHDCYTPVFVHTHAFFEFVYVQDGQCTQTIGSNNFKMTAGDFCLISPGIKHSISVFDASTIINILVRKSTFNDIFFNFLRKKNPVSAFFCDNLYSCSGSEYLTFRTGNDADLRELVLEMFVESENADEYDLELLDYQVLVLFTKILRDYGNSCQFPLPVRKNDVRGAELISYIQNNYTEISLSELSAHFRYTNEYTSRLIKKTTGMTFMQIVRQIKMNRAKNFLTDTNVPIEEISQEIGYMNPEHFIRTFKKLFGMPPGEYRRKYSDDRRRLAAE
jgi:AraC-like DNA-binding protein/mannose-6-phosphate isomerase-like protein (cupin superfamily)